MRNFPALRTARKFFASTRIERIRGKGRGKVRRTRAVLFLVGGPPVLQASCGVRRAPGRAAKGFPQERGRYAAREMAESAVPILPSRNLETTLDFYSGISP